MIAAQQFVVVPFHEHSLLTLNEGGTVYVAMRSVCEQMGLQWESQYNRLRRNPVLAATIFMTNMVAADGKPREVLTIPLDMLNGWLFGIDASRVKPELTEMVLRYQRECYRVLADYWNGNDKQHRNIPHQLAISRHRLALLKELHRTRDAALRAAIHHQLDHASRLLGLPTPELNSIGWSTPAAPDILVKFWSALAVLDSKGIEYNHAHSGELLAVNLPELKSLLIEHDVPLHFTLEVRQALWASRAPRCLHKNHAVHSRLTRKSVKCWVFEKPLPTEPGA